MNIIQYYIKISDKIYDKQQFIGSKISAYYFDTINNVFEQEDILIKEEDIFANEEKNIIYISSYFLCLSEPLDIFEKGIYA